jgi:hypothetical protein
LSFVVDDAKASTPPLSSTSARKTLPQMPTYFWDRTLATRRQERQILGELLGICGLTATALATHYTIEGRLEAVAGHLWILSAFYFCSGVFYVRMRVGRFLKKQEFPKRRFQCVLYHVLLPPTLILTWATEWMPWVSLWAYLPILVRAFWNVFFPDTELNIKRIGYTEVGYTFFFVIVFSSGWHLGAAP